MSFKRRSTIIVLLLIAVLFPDKIIPSPHTTGNVSDVKKEVNKSVLKIRGRVKDALGRKDLVKSRVYLTDSTGSVIDSTSTGGWYNGDGRGNSTERAIFTFDIPRHPATYNIEVVMPEYQDTYYTLIIDHIGKREFYREIPDILMQKAPRQLGEVTVTASKVKFYNSGDTIVYNADAFELAEGSMLDALIKQLPGVELKEGGQIYVNGEFVENLLLNGKYFFKGKNELMLDNLAAYTVKNIEVYRRSSDLQEWSGDKTNQQLVMDVKLKREYNVGWIMNYEAGAGTEQRYMARAFLNRFTNNSRLSLIGNINNLNDNRKPGESSTWTPETNTAGTMKTQLGALDYYVQQQDEKWKLSGDAVVRHTSQTDSRETSRLNFLGSDRTYDYDYMKNRTRNLSVSTSHILNIQPSKIFIIRIGVDGSYKKVRSRINNIGGAFEEDKPTISWEMLDTLYSCSPTDLQDVINRTKVSTLNSGHATDIRANIEGGWLVPHTSDYIYYSIGISHNDRKDEVWRDYLINYRADPVPAYSESRYFDNTPNRTSTIEGSLGYQYSFNNHSRLALIYNYSHSDARRDSYAYALEWLGEQGWFGAIPEGYLATLDVSQSYRSHSVTNTHSANLSFSYWSNNLDISLSPSLQLTDRNFDYYRNNSNHHVDQQHTLLTMPEFNGSIRLKLAPAMFNGRKYFRHRITLLPCIQPTLPNPVNMVDITDDTDPMNIRTGNRDLTFSVKYKGYIQWFIYIPVRNYMMNNMVEVVYSNTHNELVNGFRYDTETGVRIHRTYNVASGNSSANLHLQPSLQFGNKGQFTATYFAGLDYIRSADMIGINTDPVKSQVHTYWHVQSLKFMWQLGKQQIGFKGEINSRSTESDHPMFNPVRGTSTNLSVAGQFVLPKGFGISSDLTVYMRHGYGSPQLDRTDPVMNMRLSYVPPKSHWVFMLDGFDLFHRLSNITYSTTAQGRTIVCSNVLPRYLMLHVQYRLNIQPKKKIIDNRPSWSR